MSAIESAAGPLAASAQASGGQEGTIMPVLPYSTGWLLLGCLLLLAIALYYLLSWLLTRPRPVREVPPPAPPPISIEQARFSAMAEIGGIEHRFHTGQLTARRAHAELSLVVRDFVSRATGAPADRMTLSELRRTPYRGAARAVAEYYPVVFGARDAESVQHGLMAARRVVTLWR